MTKKIPWNKGRTGLQVSWNKTPKPIEDKIIQLYQEGLSSPEISSQLGLKGHSTILKILKRNGIETRSFGAYKRTKEHRVVARETLFKMLKSFPYEEQQKFRKRGAKKRGEQLKIDIEHQRRVGRLGGLKTHQNHPEKRYEFAEKGPKNLPKLIKWMDENKELSKKKSSETAKRTHQRDRTLASRMGKSTQDKHPNHSRETILKTLKKYPDLPRQNGQLVHQMYPGHASRMGKSNQIKHPHLSSETLKKTHRELKEKDPEQYSERQTKAMIAGSTGPTKPEKIIGSILPKDFVYNQPFFGAPDFRSELRKIIIQVDGPRHYKTMGKAYNETRLIKTKEKDKEQECRWTKKGYKIYRFTDIEIVKEKIRIIEIIKQFLN